jgi:DNA-binding NtrC family response regulator
MILFVTKDRTLLEEMTLRLRDLGNILIGVSYMEDLKTRVRHNPPDIVILDHQSSSVAPVEILQGLQALGFRGKIIILVGESSEALVHEASKLGAIQIAGRPFSVNRVICAIRIAQEQLQADRHTTSLV